MKLKERTNPDSDMNQFSAYISYDELDRVEEEIERLEIISRYQQRES